MLSCLRQSLLAMVVAMGAVALVAGPVPAQASQDQAPPNPTAGALFGALLAPPGEVSRPASQPGVARRVDRVEVELIADVEQIAPGEPFRLGLRILHDPHWHTYWRVPGDSGLPTRFEPVGPAGTVFEPIDWPAPGRYAIGPYANYGYEEEVVLSRVTRLPADFAGERARFDVQAEWLVCRDVCIPGEAALSVELPVAAPARAGKAGARFEASLLRVPDPLRAQPAGWWVGDDKAVLRLPAGLQARKAEFFPYLDAVVRPAAPQTLVQEASGQRQLLLELMPAPPGGAREQPAAGLLVADGRSYELQLQVLAAAPGPAAAVLAVAEPKRPPPGEGGGFGSTLGGFGAGSAMAGTAAAGGGWSLLLALAGALLGGMLLNLMPCVFPVIGLKLLAFAEAGRGEHRATQRHALAFAAGVVVSFVALGAGLLALRLLGESLGWGFQLQSPVFVSAMALLFVAIALNLFGVFETGLAAGRFAPEVRGSGLGSSFATGIVAVLVATPCTAPFMGGAIGYTLAAPPFWMLLVFLALGLGMALPYLLFAAFTGLHRLLPRPGPWLQTFRQLLAFPMLATAAWLAWVLTLQAGADGLLRLLVAAILVGLIAWVFGRRQHAAPSASSGGRFAWSALALLAAVGGLLLLVQIDRLGRVEAAAANGAAPAAAAAEATADWQPWSPERVAEARARGRRVFVDFTAAWCISCQANKKLVLEREAVIAAFARQDVLLLRADWTRRDAAITAELARFGRNGVPLYLAYPAGNGAAQVLPELLTVAVVTAAVGLD